MSERWMEIVRLYEAAADLAPDERSAFLKMECGEDVKLREEVERMLAQKAPEQFLRFPQEKEERLGELAGRTLGEFRLEHEIGRGGMGVVYSAHDDRLRRHVAVKVLPLLQRSDERSRQRFRREASAASRLEHPHAVSVLSSGETSEFVWYAMRWVQGHDLDAELKEQRVGTADLLPGFGSAAYVATVVSGIADLADALQAAHDLGIVHRDVKPQNILLDAKREMHLADFGLARDETMGSISLSGEIRGTPHYMSPEQARTLEAKVGRLTDVYSLSVVLYELLSLRRPYGGSNLNEILAQIAACLPLPLRQANPSVASDLATICEKGMSRLPADRFASCADLAADLRRFLRREAIHARPPSPMRRVKNTLRRHPRFAVASVLVTLAVGVAWMAGAISGRQATLAAWTARIVPALEGDASTYADARRAAMEYTAQSSLHSDDLSSKVERFTTLIEAYRDTELERIQSLKKMGLGRAPLHFNDGMGRPLSTPSSPRHAFLSGSHARELAEIFPDSEEIIELADVTELFPRVTVRIAPASGLAPDAQAEVYVRPIDTVTCSIGEAQFLGTTPLESFAMSPGEYRFVVVVGGYGFAEMYRCLELLGPPTTMHATLLPTETTRQGAVSVDGGEFHLNKGESIGCCHHTDVGSVEPFFIDEAEVSNAEFVAFLEATGRSAPYLWSSAGAVMGTDNKLSWSALPLEELNHDWLDLPATAIPWKAARAYAEWAGKRLPTHMELERALRGVNGNFDPWPEGTPLEGRSKANIHAIKESTKMIGADGDRFNEIYRYAIRDLLPVREPGYRQLPSMLFHGYGNVSEWTESPLIQPREGVLRLDPWSFLFLGGGQEAAVLKRDLSTHAAGAIDEMFVDLNRGFRCAKSTNPK